MNLSLGGDRFFKECLNSPFSVAFSQARAVDVLPVVATGNNGYRDSIASPACATGAVRVGAVYDANVGGLRWTLPQGGSCTDTQTLADQVTCFSNSAHLMTLLAPGALIDAAGINSGGTSQATPHVSGAIAVLRAPNAFPVESLEQTVSRLVSTGKPVIDLLNSLVKPRLDLQAAVEATPLPTIGSPTIFQQLSIANGVTTDGNGNVYIHYDNGLTNVVSRFTPEGNLQWSTQIGGFGDINRTGRLATVLGSGEIIDLLQTGELVVLDQTTGAISAVFDFRTETTVDTSNVYDVATGVVMNMSGQILQPNIVYGDVDVRQQGNQFEIFATGISSNSAVPFVIRIRLVPDQPIDAKVLVASTTQFGNEDGAIVVPRGLAVNNGGVVLTSLPVLGSPPCSTCSGVDVGITFDANYEPATDPPPSIILNSLDLHSRGMSTDNQGNFFLATGEVGTSICGQFGSGALVVVSKSMNSVGCGLIGAVLAGSEDIALNPTDDTAYMTLSAPQLLGFNGVLEFPVEQPSIVVADSDDDTIPDNLDNCTTIANPAQSDTDSDKIGNACDPDFNQNGIVDQFDFSQLKACFGSTECPLEDLNGNGVVDQFDFSQLKGMFGQAPGPSALAP